MPTLTPNLGFALPLAGERGWGARYNANFSLIDGLAGSIGQFAVRATDIDATSGAATSLRYTIAPGTFVNSDRSLLAIPAVTRSIPANATTFVWHDGSGDPGTGASFPAVGQYMPLALITADGTKITSIVDRRFPAPILRDQPPTFLPNVYKSTSTAFGVFSYTLSNFETVVFGDATQGALGIVLPPAGAGDSDQGGRVLTIVKYDASANAVTVSGNGKTINGQASYSLTARYQRVTLTYSGLTGVAEWVVIGT